jgi:hypothetical protein
MEFCGAGSVTDLVKGKENLNTRGSECNGK